MARSPEAWAREPTTPRPRADPDAPDGSGRTLSVSAGSVKKIRLVDRVEFIFEFYFLNLLLWQTEIKSLNHFVSLILSNTILFFSRDSDLRNSSVRP